MPTTPTQLEEMSREPLYPGGESETEKTGAVRLGDLLREIEELILYYIGFPHKELASLIAVWIAGTYLYNQFDCFGYLALRSATPACGKSKLLRLIAGLSMGNPSLLTMPTASVLFRTTRKVLIMDEVDHLRNQNKEAFGDVLAILNSGFERSGTVPRSERTGNNWEVKEYPVYGPKAFAGLENLADTLSSRSFSIQMQRAPKMPRLCLRRLSPQLERIRTNLQFWADKQEQEVFAMYDQLPHELPELAGRDDRFQDIAEPLMVLAFLADAECSSEGEVTARLLAGINCAAGRREPSKRERDLLVFLEVVEARLNGVAEFFVPSQDLLTFCREREEFSGWESTKALAGFLKHFDLTSRSNGKARGYDLTQDWVASWRERYRLSTGPSHDGEPVPPR